MDDQGKLLRDKQQWVGGQSVHVPAVPTAESFSPDTPQEIKEQIIRSWKTIAILKAESADPFMVGFIRNEEIWILNVPIHTINGVFGMRIGRDDLNFFALDFESKKPINLTLVEVTEEDNPRYKDLIIY